MEGLPRILDVHNYKSIRVLNAERAVYRVNLEAYKRWGKIH